MTRDARNRNATNRDAPNRDATNRDAKNRDASNRNATNRDATKRDTTNRDATNRDATNRVRPLPTLLHPVPRLPHRRCTDRTTKFWIPNPGRAEGIQNLQPFSLVTTPKRGEGFTNQESGLRGATWTETYQLESSWATHRKTSHALLTPPILKHQSVFVCESEYGACET
jgi:hypothetical protein